MSNLSIVRGEEYNHSSFPECVRPRGRVVNFTMLPNSGAVCSRHCVCVLVRVVFFFVAWGGVGFSCFVCFFYLSFCRLLDGMSL